MFAFIIVTVVVIDFFVSRFDDDNYHNRYRCRGYFGLIVPKRFGFRYPTRAAIFPFLHSGHSKSNMVEAPDGVICCADVCVVFTSNRYFYPTTYVHISNPYPLLYFFAENASFVRSTTSSECSFCLSVSRSRRH